MGGFLVADAESMCLALSARAFGQVILQHSSVCVLAAKYARLCAWHLSTHDCSDATRFRYSLAELDKLIAEANLENNSDNHIIFISHYKQEAGTEAALMRHALKEAFGEVDLETPVFVDSEDLTDLEKLLRHVRNSHVLVVLLTPGLLTRPWCVLEIVTAFDNDVQIVPVEIQRPGMTYQFPDDQFYARLHKGGILDSSALSLLEKEGVSLSSIEAAIRHMFLKIAVPYSPHKSENIRSAELLDIIKRTPQKYWNAAEPLEGNFRMRGRNSMSGPGRASGVYLPGMRSDGMVRRISNQTVKSNRSDEGPRMVGNSSDSRMWAVLNTLR